MRETHHNTKPVIMPVLYFFLLWIVSSHCVKSQDVPRLYSSDSSRISVENDYYDLISDNSSTRKTFINGDNFAVNVHLQSILGIFSIEARQNKTNVSHDTMTDGLKFSLQQNIQSIGLKYSRMMKWLSIKSNIEFLKSSDQPLINITGSVGISFQRDKLQNYEIEVRRQHVPFVFATNYETENLTLTNPISFISLDHTFRYHYDPFFLTAEISHSYPQKINDNNFYTINNQANIHSWNVCVNFACDKSRITWEMNEFSMRSEFEFNQHQLNFGYLDINFFGVLKTAISYSVDTGAGGTLSLAASYYHANGDIIGSLESWPFASVVQSLFMNRVYIRASGALNAQRFETMYAIPGNKFQIIPRLSFIRIVPELTMETWQPIFMAIGVSKYLKSELAIREAGLLYLNIGTNFSRLGVQFTIEANQIIPLYLLSKQTSGLEPSMSSKGDENKSNTDGGRWFRLAIVLPF